MCSAKQNSSYDGQKCCSRQQLTILRNIFCIYMSEKQQSSLAYSRMNNSYPDGEDITTEDWQVSKQTDTCPHTHASRCIRRRKHW